MNWISPHLAFDECSSGMKRKVHWDDEGNGESEMEPFEEASETDVSDDEQNNDDEPRIKDVLENLCHKIPIIHFSLLFLFLCMQLFNRFFSLFVVFIVVSFKRRR